MTVRYFFFGLMALFLLCASPAAAGHGAALFNTRRATPGIELELIAMPPGPDGEVAKYRLRATGVPRGVTFNVWSKDFHQSVQEIASGFRIDESGTPTSSAMGGRRLDTIVLAPGPYPRGAAWDLALVSVDQTIKAFARVIPRPLAARSGPCTLSLELVSDRGDHFLASGAGFVAGEDVRIESLSSGQIYRRESRISAQGLLRPDNVSHVPAGPDRRARYTVRGRSCEVTIEYEWGEGAVK
jgi:hypothetical protein